MPVGDGTPAAPWQTQQTLSEKTVGKLAIMLSLVSFLAIVMTIVVAGAPYSIVSSPWISMLALLGSTPLGDLFIPVIGVVVSGLLGLRIVSRNSPHPLSALRRSLTALVISGVSILAHMAMVIAIFVLMYVTGWYRG
jgi:hypothetical protein